MCFLEEDPIKQMLHIWNGSMKKSERLKIIFLSKFYKIRKQSSLLRIALKMIQGVAELLVYYSF